LTRDRQNSRISRLAIGTRVQGSFLIGSVGVEVLVSERLGLFSPWGTPLSLE